MLNTEADLYALSECRKEPNITGKQEVNTIGRTELAEWKRFLSHIRISNAQYTDPSSE